MSRILRPFKAVWWPVAVLALLTACATTGTEQPGDRAKARAQERWDLVLADQIEEAYLYFTPGYRSSVSRRDWERKILVQQVRWSGAEVSKVECESEDVCTVWVYVNYSVRGALPGVSKYESRTSVSEKWIRSGGDWFYLPEN